MAKLFSKANRRKWMVRVFPPLLILFVRLLYFTCKKKFYFNKSGADIPSVYAMWHGELLMIPYAYLHYTGRKSIDAIISRHSDGEMVARFITLQGGGALRGSSSKGGNEVLRLALKSLENGRDIGITPDGPRGPRHSVAHGIVTIATLKKVPIITINCKASSFWSMRSWDQFSIPKPFSTLEFYFGDPFYVHEMPSNEAIELVREKLLLHAQ